MRASLQLATLAALLVLPTLAQAAPSEGRGRRPLDQEVFDVGAFSPKVAGRRPLDLTVFQADHARRALDEQLPWPAPGSELAVRAPR